MRRVELDPAHRFLFNHGNNKARPAGIARYVPGLALFSQLKPELVRGELIAAVTVFAILVPSAIIAAGLLQGFPAATSSLRTVVSDQMGGKTEIVGLIAVQGVE